MKIQLLPTTFDQNGQATQQQHSCCFVVNDRVAIDAGSLAMSTNAVQKKQIRDVILTHAHLDHIAGLPLFIDDLFATIKRPIQIHATQEVIDALENYIFNWTIYPRFSELENVHGKVMNYRPFEVLEKVEIADLIFQTVEVNHKVPSVGMLVSDENSKIALSGDTSEMDGFWELVNKQEKLHALLIECAFPDELDELAHSSHHLTPNGLEKELKKFTHSCPVYVVNIKPMYREQIIAQLATLNNPQLNIFEIGKIYQF
jgi:cAMP phosphodiesterase